MQDQVNATPASQRRVCLGAPSFGSIEDEQRCPVGCSVHLRAAQPLLARHDLRGIRSDEPRMREHYFRTIEDVSRRNA